MVELRVVKRWNEDKTVFTKHLQYRQCEDRSTYAQDSQFGITALQMSAWQDVEEIWE